MLRLYSKIVLYLTVEHFNNVALMAEATTIEILKSITEMDVAPRKVDDLKRLCLFYVQYDQNLNCQYTSQHKNIAEFDVSIVVRLFITTKKPTIANIL